MLRTDTRLAGRTAGTTGGARHGRWVLVVLLLALAVAMLAPAVAAAAGSGPNYGTGASVDATGADVPWTEPGNIGADDASYATSVDIPALGGTSYLLFAQDFGFAIPSGATIDGIQVQIDRMTSANPSGTRDSVVQLTKNGSALSGSNLADAGTNWPATLITASYGGESDLWGTTWTAAEINSPGFGVALQAVNQNNKAARARTATVDFIRITVTYTVRIPLTVAASCIDKVYDGATVATVTLGSADIQAGDMVTLAYTSAAFADKNVGADKPVSVEGISISGADAGKYALQNMTAETTAAITPAALSVEGALAADKTYDGTTEATVDFSAAALAGVLAGEDVTLDAAAASAAFATKDVGADKPVSVSGLTLTGADAGNYALAQPELTASVTARELTVTARGLDKVYDGTTDAGITLESDALAGDDVTIDFASATFDTELAGADKPVAVDGISIAGADAGNYELQNTSAATSAGITPKGLTITANDQTKLFGTAFIFTGTEFTASGLVTGDAVTAVTLTSSGAAASAVAGSYPIVASGATGAGLGNYTPVYVDGTMTVAGGYRIGPFAKPLRSSDARRFHRGSTIRVAFKVKDQSGAPITTAKPRLRLKAKGTVVWGPRTVKYDPNRGLYIYRIRTTEHWKLRTLSASVTLGAGSAGRTVYFRIVR